MSLLNRTVAAVFGTKHEREMKRLRPTIDKINALEPSMKELNDAQLQAKTAEFRQRLDNGESLDSLMCEAFAVCREAAWRRLGMRHYDVQLIGGMILHHGNIAEMKTGEGKTLVATLPMYLNGLTGKGAHLVTVNDYLATRDCEWMGQLYHFLGLTTGTITHGLDDEERKTAYGADITYCTNNELGFDYLRDNMKFRLDQYVQRGHNFAIVDECDSILVDEARTPLIISGPAEESTDQYVTINKIIGNFQKDTHFTMEEKSKTVSLTEEGNHLAEKLLGVENIFDPRNIQLMHFIYQGLKAHHLFQLDVDYMVRDGEIVIVDEFTGRLMPGRRWSEGLHQAIEAKEGVKVRSENQTLASITFQNYFRMYSTLAGMTGTADTEAVEFKKIYNLDVSVIPTNKPIARLDHDDVVYKSEAAKFKAIAEDVKERNEKGQPVLVGTVSIEKSEKLSRALKNAGITHNVLNAKHHEREAEIVAQAGRKNSVTIATNMAGRGTDIVLGGNAEMMAKAETGETEGERFETAFQKYQPICAAEKEEVLEAGGLYIVGTERHESRRIDNQLRGRSGRQGDPGGSKFYLSLDDNLMRIFNGERIQKIMERLNVPDDEPITARMVTNAIEGAQRKVEGHNFDIRKHLLEYDDVMNQQRNAIYSLRKEALNGENSERMILDMLGDTTSHVLDTYVPEGSKQQEWNLEGLDTALSQQYGIKLNFGDTSQLSIDKITETVSGVVKEVFDTQKKELGEYFDDVQKMILLDTIDTRWKEHLAAIDQLKEGINLRAYAQKDPLIEYKKEGFKMFQHMQMSIKSEVIEKLLKIQIVPRDFETGELEARPRGRASEYQYESPDEASAGGGFQDGFMPAPQQQGGGGLPFAQPQAPPEAYGGQEEGPKLNRAERRRRAKLEKKRRR